ncbi:MAG: hypothetical protein ABI150_01495 [Nitrobacter sp.]
MSQPEAMFSIENDTVGLGVQIVVTQPDGPRIVVMSGQSRLRSEIGSKLSAARKLS